MAGRLYSVGGLAGCASIRRGTCGLVAVYHAEQAGIDVGHARWAASCEAHSVLVSCRTLEQAIRAQEEPHEWCELCQAEAVKVRLPAVKEAAHVG